jgi:hypothetical protein
MGNSSCVRRKLLCAGFREAGESLCRGFLHAGESSCAGQFCWKFSRRDKKLRAQWARSSVGKT